MNKFDQVISMDTLYRCWQKVSTKNACGGLDGVDVSLYRFDVQKNLRTLQCSIATGSYFPYKENTYTGLKGRKISVCCVDDKIVQTALAECLAGTYTPARGTHGFIPKRSVFTAKKSLDTALSDGIYDYAKIDIRHFYDSIDSKVLLRKIKMIITDDNLLNLIELLIKAHSPGISTGSCLSPALSNLYLADFDHKIECNSLFFSRYVDDMLVAPVDNLALIKTHLAEVGLEINTDKSKPVSAAEGFNYLGFYIKRDIERTIDTALQNGNFALAEQLYETQPCDIAAEAKPMAESSQAESSDGLAMPEYDMPNTIRNIICKCHIIETIVNKAAANKHLDFGEKTHLLQIFHCLGEDGAKYIHNVLSQCDDYDYAETQRRIKKYNMSNPLGCKKLCERIGSGSDEKCGCNFTNEKLYPTPIIHALRVDRECFKPMEPKDNIGHFKAKNPRDKATDALGYLIELNKKQYEISEQQKIFRGQIEDLFERTNTLELQTPQGLLIKTVDGLFIKVG